jgi:hypothetical protein
MYSYHYYRYVELPKLPTELIAGINRNFDDYEIKVQADTYTWSNSFNQEVNAWCQKNICADLYWGFQIIRGNLITHIDRETTVKFVYLLDTGGDNVVTSFYADDNTTVIDSVVLEPHRWHILKVDAPHGVTGVDADRTRFSITGKIF